MELFPELEKRYTKDQLSSREAQRQAQFIAFGPVIFQATRLLLKYGIADLLRDSEGLTEEEIAEKTGLDLYTVKCLVEAGLTIGTLLVNTETDKFTISKVGWFLLTDDATRANIDFNHDVCYEGLFHLDESFKEHRPVGLEHFGPWKTIYEGLSSLPSKVQESWFGFDHYYSDHSFDEALKVIFRRNISEFLDVGGNTGKMALKCVGAYPDVNVTILDLPQQIALMQKAVADKEGHERIRGIGIDMLDKSASFPTDRHYDAIWMSQFLDCFSEEEIVSILQRTADIMDENSRLYIMELLWNRQKWEPAAMCLTLTSLYFTAMANGNSKMYYSGDLVRLIDKAGLEAEEICDAIGYSHNIIICKKKHS